MVFHQTWVSWRFLATLTKFDLRLTLGGFKNPNFDRAARTGWNQHHYKDYQILILMTIHGSKSELNRLRYHENRNNAPFDALLTFESHNFQSDRWIFKIHTFLRNWYLRPF